MKKLNSKILYLACYIVGSIYCAGLIYGSTVLQNIYTVLFILFLTSLFIVNLKKIELKLDQELNPYPIFFQLIILNLSIAITAFILESPNTFFWMTDSFVLHLPESIKFMKFYKGDFRLISEIGQHRGCITHALTGFFLAIFGVNVFATILAQIVFKICILFFIYKISVLLWNRKIACIAILLYGLCPTVFFYNLVLYKEGAVQTLFSALVFFSLQIFLKKKYLYIIPLIIVYILLSWERNYIAYICLPMFILLTYDLFFKYNYKNFAIFIIVTAIFAGFGHKYSSLEISLIFKELQRIRSTHEVFTDVINRYNYEIPYPLAFLKILFSPYFTFNKFKIFTNFSTLLIWGSLINQLIILSSVFGFINLVKQKIIHLYLWLPFIIFLIAAAYISPWSGRLRDSFYPLIACYAAYYLAHNKYFKKYT